MILIGSFVALIVFVVLFSLSLILEKFEYGSVDDINTIPGLLACISVVASTLLLTFILLCIGG